MTLTHLRPYTLFFFLSLFLSACALIRQIPGLPTPVLGFAALALANSLAFTAEALLMLLILRRRGIL